MANAYNTDLSKFNFDYLEGTRYSKVYEVLNVAKDLYKVDKGACCTKLRYALEIIVSEIMEICGWQSNKRERVIDNIRVLENKLPSDFVDDGDKEIFFEMHNVRRNGNDGTHYDGEKEIDLDKASHTSWIAMKKICKWAVTFEDRYKKYQKEAQEEAKRLAEKERREKEERDKKINGYLKTAGKVAVGIAAAVIGVFIGKRVKW